MRRLCVFCGSNFGADPRYAQAAVDVAQRAAREGVGLVYGGGAVGLMGVLADAALAAGAEVIGVIPEGLAAREVAHKGVSRMEVVPSMHARKQLMADLSDAFVALPGGYGTLEEFAEIVTWAQLGIHRKPVGLLDVAGYFAPLVAFVDQGVRQGFIRPEYRALFVSAETVPEMWTRLWTHELPPVVRWMAPRES